MGERLQKTISMYRAANKSKDGSGRMSNDRAHTGQSPYAQQTFGNSDKMNQTMSGTFPSKGRSVSQLIKPAPRRVASRQSIDCGLILKNPPSGVPTTEIGKAQTPVDLQVVGTQKSTEVIERFKDK